MTHTLTLPIDDKSMWRRLAARTHPDTGGDHELFIWAGAVRDVICGDEPVAEIPRSNDQGSSSRRREASTSDATDRVPFDEDAYFEFISDRAGSMADAVAEPYGFLLRAAADCQSVEDGPLYDQQYRGASYKSLAAIGHQVGMSKDERVQWYRIAEAIPLSQRHAGHILSRLKRQAA
jgi:hypothetical protein